MNAVEELCLQAAATAPQATLWIAGPHVPDIEAAASERGGAIDVKAGAPGRGVPNLQHDGRHILWSLSAYIAAKGFEDVLERLVKLRSDARDSGADLIVVLEKGAVDDGSLARLAGWADGVMELGFDRQGFGLYPYLQVNKIRGVPGAAGMILFKETDAGLFFESTRRVV